jgi:hypothetical protein
MSVLDMFASALGAFIMISVILFPFYNQAKQLEQARENIKKTNDNLGKVEAELLKSEETSRTQVEEIRKGSDFRTSLVACEQTMNACKATLTKVFIAIGMEWEEACDVDIYITDPSQRQFYYSNRKIPPSKAELSIDMVYGPGIEVWQNPEAETGDYKIEYKKGGSCSALASSSDGVLVKGWLIDRGSGIRPLPERTLTLAKESVVVATIRVSADGVSTIQAAGP